MATSGITSATGTSLVDAPVGTNPNGILGKDDFLKLLLLELKYQDPTAPMDTEKILAQTSQLATLESTENTNKALENLAASLTSSMQYSSIGAIGKIADTGSNAVVYQEGSPVNFEIYFPENATNASVNVLDSSGNILRTNNIGAVSKGIGSFSWDGRDSTGASVDEGIYYIEANYATASGETKTTRVGLYPIESIKFDSGKAYAKLGSNYVEFDSIHEVTQ